MVTTRSDFFAVTYYPFFVEKIAWSTEVRGLILDIKKKRLWSYILKILDYVLDFHKRIMKGKGKGDVGKWGYEKKGKKLVVIIYLKCVNKAFNKMQHIHFSTTMLLDIFQDVSIILSRTKYCVASDFGGYIVNLWRMSCTVRSNNAWNKEARTSNGLRTWPSLITAASRYSTTEY